MKEYIMLVGECIWAVFTSEFDTSVSPKPEEAVNFDITKEVLIVTWLYLLACVLAFVIGVLVN